MTLSKTFNKREGSKLTEYAEKILNKHSFKIKN